MKISVLKQESARALAELNGLVKQLRGDEFFPGKLAELRSIVRGRDTALFVAKDGKRIVGAATLYVIQKIGKRTGHVEDVVVDAAYRGKGLGEKIMRALIKDAKKRRLTRLHLTSRPSRQAAQALYIKLGFLRKETDPFTKKL